MTDLSKLGKIALFGAAGAVGHALTPLLAARGEPYRVVGRDAARLHSFEGAEVAAADFLSGQGVDEAASGIDTIVYLAGAPYTNFEQHPVMTRNALAAAKRAGVSRFVHVAPVYSYGPAASIPVSESQPHRPATKKGRYRLAQEQLVLQANGDAMRTLIVCLPDFYGPNAENSVANYFITEAIAGKPATFIGPLNVEREFIYVPDAAEPLLRLATLDDVYGRYWNLGGVAPITGAEFVRLVFAELGKPERVRAVPKIALRALGLFNPLMREFVEMYYLYDSAFILDDSALRAKLGNVTKMPYAEGVRRTIASISSN
ncbi:MAG TPA: NAD-dependent epimerase/dehydratase family protein [Candidatus Acidoferrales bacterium]|nr:NAD-dependent epimerase/dehydratase family protein [Candidatus Acidoferrales bacterium]